LRTPPRPYPEMEPGVPGHAPWRVYLRTSAVHQEEWIGAPETGDRPVHRCRPSIPSNRTNSPSNCDPNRPAGVRLEITRRPGLAATATECVHSDAPHRRFQERTDPASVFRSAAPPRQPTEAERVPRPADRPTYSHIAQRGAAYSRRTIRRGLGLPGQL